MSGENGKGDKRRPCDEKAYGRNWDRAFKKKKHRHRYDMPCGHNLCRHCNGGREGRTANTCEFKSCECGKAKS